MKHRLGLILLFAAVTLAGMAQTIGEAFYIYRNDGQFNAFFRDEILSIEYSNYDADSVYYDEIVTQVVNTADSSVYKIPLAAIDSVAFVQPETIVSDDVFPLTAEHSPYISDADTLKFSMLSSTPDALRPKVGNIVVATADCDAFAHGIIARVEQITNDGSYYRYECSKAYLEDVFEQLVAYTNGRVEETGVGYRDAMRRVSFSETLWNQNWTGTITGGGTTTVLGVGNRATVTITVCKTLTTPFFFQLQLQNTLTTSIDFTAESTASIYKEMQIGKTITAGRIPIPYTGLLWIEPKLSLYGYFDEKGKVELKYGGHFNRTDFLTFTYSQRQWTFTHTPTTDAGTDIAQLSMEGSAEIGLKPQIDFSLNGQQAGFGFNGRLGLKENINFVFDMTHLKDGGLYDAMRDSYCRTTIPWSINVHANANIFSRYDGSQSEDGSATFSHTFAPREEPRWGEDRYIFPLFSNVEGKRQDGMAEAKANVSRTTLLPVQVGFSLIDQDKNIVSTAYDSRSYGVGNTFNSYSCELSGMESSGKYTVRPSVKLFGQDVLASPEAEVSGEHSCPDSNHPHWIDLGLPSGTQWRCCNEGASSPEAYGGYYTFGQVASAPTLAQIEELLNNCSYVWTTQNGVEGGKFTGPNGGTIFLPAAGLRRDGEFFYVGSYGSYCSSTSYDEYHAYGLYFEWWGSYWDYYYYRDDEWSVRPVR